MSDNKIYSARYSGVDVYEFVHPTGSVMKRKSDDWVNATHILKVANFSKAKRTRILEKEVLKETHEKVQGGFGKYQGTWVPMNIALNLAEKYGVYDELKVFFDFKHLDGSASPPPAPKHHHASRTDSKRKATKSASMSVISDNPKGSKQPKLINMSTQAHIGTILPTTYANEQNGEFTINNETTSGMAKRNGIAVINPVIRKSRRGRPPSVGTTQRKLGVGKNVSLQRSQSDMIFPKPLIPNSSISTNQLPFIQRSTLEPLNELKQEMRKDQFREIKIDDGLSSDIEQTDNNEINEHNFVAPRQSSAIKSKRSIHSIDSSPKSVPSSPNSGTTSPLNDVDDEDGAQVPGTSPIRSGIARFSTEKKPEKTDINDKVNDYLSKLVEYFISDEMRTNNPVADELLRPPPDSAPFIDSPIDSEQHSAFHWACSMGQLSIAEALFNAGANIRATNSEGQTPLMRSAMFHNSYTKHTFPMIFKLLHETVFDEDRHGQTVLHHIIKRKSTTPSAVYYLDIFLGSLKDFAQPYGIDLLMNAQDENGNTALHLAALNGDKRFFNTLISNGSLLTIQNKEGRTPNEIMNNKYEDGDTSNAMMINRSPTFPAAMVSDYLMYPSQAATTISRGIPNITNAMKRIADAYNDSYAQRDEEEKALVKTLKSISTTIDNIDGKTTEVLDNERGKDLDTLIEKQLKDVEELQRSIARLKKEMESKLEYRETKRLDHFMKENSDDINTVSNDDNIDGRIKLATELSVFQLKRKFFVQEILKLFDNNMKIHKYRRMISEGTEIKTDEIDACLDTILQSLLNGS
ncbi:transcription factor MBP1 NDAI_0D04430 [Naumovozyma dairenensis CBS 421]|uniref:Transcription factor MBP1 n=1 Tax=Naumovozyma dairenensis (strain ATCC 10597 / BCRC 20456 / CBS 421 / NBRC 0211 / NRRL Y-12639) TaxID=1071378 RepID=G0WAE6_NAUDC|nr:hypothetical protein NDAI_0D04430 [Naumovozyma dairenensis CBS 421]CCD24757.1 hypothetical protein NDAI_0D04430 [Naumovozyma dairenensis CBS 421]